MSDPTTSRSHDGFSLIELLTVVVVLGVLAAIVVMSVRGTSDRAEDAATATDEHVLATAMEAYHAEHGRYGTEGSLVTSGLLRAESSSWDVVLDIVADDYVLVEADPATVVPDEAASPTAATVTTSVAPTTVAPATTAPATTAPATTVAAVTPTTSPAAGAVTCSFAVVSTWDSGGNGSLAITNATASQLTGWTVRIAHGNRTIGLWNASDTATSSTHLTASNLPWNGVVAAGATVTPTGGSVSGAGLTAGQSFGCTFVPAATAEVSSVTCAFVVDSAWGSGGNGSLAITNGSSVRITAWTVRIVTDSSSIGLWNASSTVEASSVTATNLSWNGVVAAGTTVTPTGGTVSGSGITAGDTFDCTVVGTG